MHRILLLSPYPPYPPRSGGALRIYNLLLGLSQHHDVLCLTFAPNSDAVAALEPLRETCRLVTVPGLPPRTLRQRAWTTLTSLLPDMALRSVSPDYALLLHKLLTSQPFDIVQAESIEMASYGLLAAPYPARLVLDEFNAEYVLQRRAALTDLRQIFRTSRATMATAYSLVQWMKLARYEQQLLHRYHDIVTVSEEDRHALLRLQPRARISIVPNGVDTGYFKPAFAPETRHSGNTLVFTGTLDFRPNVDAVVWFVEQVLPLIQAQQPEVRFLIVGRSPAPAVQALHNGISVIVYPDVPDVRPFIETASVYVIPLRMGGGVRLKLLEALAMRTAVVTSTMGAEGVPELSNGKHVLLADRPDAFAAATLQLLTDTALRQQLGATGRDMVVQCYDWRVIVPLLEAIYEP